MSEFMAFLRGVARNPVQVGAISPTGPFLAERVVRAADIQQGHVVVELGAGTGSLTKRIVQAAPDVPFLALEPDPDMADVLRGEVPSVVVAEKLAQDLPQLAVEWGYPKVDRVVSGLPWALWPGWVQEPIVDAVWSAMGPTARLVAFTYVHAQILPASLRLRKILQRYFLSVRRTTIQWANVPPAFVYVCDRPRPQPLSRSIRPRPVRVLRLDREHGGELGVSAARSGEHGFVAGSPPAP